MKKISWEIVVAGIVFIVAAAFMLNKDSNDDYTKESITVATVDESDIVKQNQQATVIIDLQNLEELKKLEDLKKLKELEKLKKLKRLFFKYSEQ